MEMNRKGLIRGDFGKSYLDGQKVETKIWDKIGISFAFSLISILIAYLISIPLGIYSAYKKDSTADRVSSLIVFILIFNAFIFCWFIINLFAVCKSRYLAGFLLSGIQDATTFNPRMEFGGIGKQLSTELLI